MSQKDIFDTLGQTAQQDSAGAQKYGYQNPRLLMSNLPSEQAVGPVIDPFSRGSYYGRVFDPKTQMSGHEANILQLLRQQDI